PCRTSLKTMMAPMVDTTMPAMVTEWAARLLIFMHSRPDTSAPTRGASGTTRYRVSIVTASALQAVEIFDVDGLQVAEQHDQDRETDRRLCGGDGQDEKYENLAGRVAEIVRKRDEIHIDGEQHELDRHQQDDHILAIEENPDHADREQDRTQYQVMLQ